MKLLFLPLLGLFGFSLPLYVAQAAVTQKGRTSSMPANQKAVNLQNLSKKNIQFSLMVSIGSARTKDSIGVVNKKRDANPQQEACFAKQMLELNKLLANEKYRTFIKKKTGPQKIDQIELKLYDAFSYKKSSSSAEIRPFSDRNEIKALKFNDPFCNKPNRGEYAIENSCTIAIWKPTIAFSTLQIPFIMAPNLGGEDCVVHTKQELQKELDQLITEQQTKAQITKQKTQTKIKTGKKARPKTPAEEQPKSPLQQTLQQLGELLRTGKNNSEEIVTKTVLPKKAPRVTRQNRTKAKKRMSKTSRPAN